MAESKDIVLITGANGGIGFELASQLLADPSKHVILCSRSLERGEKALEELKTLGKPGSIELLQLDVTDEKSVVEAARTMGNKHGRLDALVNNAAVGSQGDTQAPIYANAFATNTTGVVLVTEAFEPFLSNSTGTPRLINVSSGAGSIGKRIDPNTTTSKIGFWGLAYGASKAALNCITVTQATVYGTRSPDSKETDRTKPGAQGKPWKVFAYTPGFTISNLGPHNNAESGASPTSEGAAPLVAILNGERDDEHGCFLSKDGQYPW